MDTRYETFWQMCQKTLPSLGLILGDDDFLVEDSIQIFYKALKKKYPDLKNKRLNIKKLGDWSKLVETLSGRDFFTKQQLIICTYPQTSLTTTSTPIIEKTLAHLSKDQWVLFVTKKLTPKQKKHPLHQLCQKKGFSLTLWPLNARSLTGWIQERGRTLGVTLTSPQIQHLIQKTDQQIWAIAQTLERLSLSKEEATTTQSELDAAITVEYDPAIYTLINEALEGKATSTLKRFDAHITSALMPALTGALTKEARLLYRIAYTARHQKPLHAAIKEHCHWPSKQRYLQLALERHDPSTLSPLLRRLFDLDKINKGMQEGDAMTAMQDVLIILATAQTKRTLIPYYE